LVVIFVYLITKEAQHACNDSGSTRIALQLVEFSQPECGTDDILLKVSAYGVCRTDLHIQDGELSGPKLPLIPGHEIIGIVVEG
jgi:D-arabinose 1-dehydrogenase-like Zn-dependent alcohol dehydrogenase